MARKHPQRSAFASSWCCAAALNFFSEASVAIDGSKFKAVNTRDRNFTQLPRCSASLAQIDESQLPVISRSSTAPIVSRGSCTGGQDYPAQREDRQYAAGGDLNRLNGLEHLDDADRGQADIPD